MPSRAALIPWRAYPALLAALCFGAGIALGAHAGGSLQSWCLGAVGGALSLSIVLFYRTAALVTLLPLVRTASTALLLFFLGGLLYVSSQRLPGDHLVRQVDTWPAEIVLTGRIASRPRTASYGTRFMVDARRHQTHADSGRSSGRVQVTVWRSFSDTLRTAPYHVLRRGDVVRLQGTLQPLPTRRNPADFDYGRYLARRGIHAALTAEQVELLRSGRLALLSRLISSLRRQVRHALPLLFPSPRARAVLQALVLGERHRISQDTRDRFARNGLLHLLAISGLHVLLVGFVLYNLLKPTLLRLRLPWHWMEDLRSVLTLLVLLCYTLLTGASAATVRAVVMATLLMGSTLLQRRTYALNALGAAALVLLIRQPAQLFDVGFQLSFGAVAAIVTLIPLFERAISLPRSFPWRDLGSLLFMSAAATLGTLPVLLYHFGYASFAGLLLNLAAVPVTMLALAAALMALTTAAVTPPLAPLFGTAAQELVHGLLLVGEVGDATLSWAAVHGFVRNPWLVGALAGGLLSLALWHRPRPRWRLMIVSLLLLAAGCWMHIARGVYRPDLEVIFFDVGQGDAALLQLPNGRHVLVDSGPRTPYSNAGTRTLLPHLRRYGITCLDAVVVSHAHSDHLGGLLALLREVPVRRVLHNGRVHSSELYTRTFSLLDSLDVPHAAVNAGDTLLVDPAVRMQVLSPSPWLSPSLEENDRSLVLRVGYGRTSLLFLGDAEATAERSLVARYDSLLVSDVVKIGHHGSATSSTLPLVRQVASDTSRSPVAVVSVGRQNIFGLPDMEVIERWQEHKATVWSTAQRGALWLRSDGTRFRRISWR